MRIRDDFDGFYEMENEITAPMNVPAWEPPPAAEAQYEEPRYEDRWEAPPAAEVAEIRAFAEERVESYESVREWVDESPIAELAGREEAIEVLQEMRAIYAEERNEAVEMIDVLDWFDASSERFAFFRERLEERRDAALEAEAELLRQQGIARSSTNPNYVDGQIDFSRLGTGFNGQLPPQIYWDEEMVNATCTFGQARGGFTQEEMDNNWALAQAVYLNGEDPAATVPEINAGDLAALIAETGVDLARVDPNQLVSAMRYINNVESEEERAERMRKALGCFQTLATVGAPELDEDLMREKMWQIARVPGHALEDMSTAEIAKTYQEVCAATNGPAGQSEIKIDNHTLKIETNDEGVVTQSECKKDSVWSKIGSVLKVVISIAAIIPSPLQPFAAIASGAISAYRAARDGSILGAIAAVAGAVGAGFAEWGGAALQRMADVARGVSSVARGIQSVQRGGLSGIIGGVAGIVGGVAGITGDGLQGAADGLQRLATRLAPISAIQAYRGASRAVSDAEQALDAARTSGDPAAIRAAQQALDDAKRNQRSALFSTMSSAASAAGTFAGNGSTFGRSMNVVGRTFDVARGVNDRDYLSAATGALGAINAARGPQEGFDLLQSAGNVLDAGNGYRLSLQNERAANAAVEQAEAALAAARRSGDSEAIDAAEDALRDARRNRGDAIAGTYASELDLGQTLDSTVQQYRQSQAANRAREAAEDEALRAAEEEQKKREEGAASLKAGADEAVEELEDVLTNDRATGGFATIAEDAIATIEALKNELDVAVASGDLEAIHRAADALEEARVDALSRAETLRKVLGPVELQLPAPLLAETFEMPATLDHRVRSGDRLELLAAQNGLTVEDILRANPGLDPRRMREGQVIQIPTETQDSQGARNLQIARANAAHMVDSADSNYTVQSGDSLNALAGRYGVSVAELRRLNPQLAEDGTVYRDQRLNVPGATPPPPAETPRLDPQALMRAGLGGHQMVNDARTEEAEQHEGFLGGLFNPMATANLTTDRDARERARVEFEDAAAALVRAGANKNATEEERRAALDRYLQSQQEFSRQEGIVQSARTDANYLSVVTLGAREGNRMANQATTIVADEATIFANNHLPAPVADVVGTGLQLAAATQRQANDLLFGVAEGFNYQINGFAGLGADLLTHPIDTAGNMVRGVGTIVDRYAQTTQEGRAFQFMANAAFGAYGSLEEAANDFNRMMNPADLMRARGEFAYDMGNALFAGASDAFANGDIGRGFGLVAGNLINPLAAGSALRGGAAATRGLGQLDDAARIAAGEAGLPRALGAADGTFLRARIPGYPDVQSFYQAFGRAIDETTTELSALSQRGAVSADDVENLVVRIGTKHPGFGKPGSEYGVLLATDNPVERIIDKIGTEGRHAYYFGRADDAWQAAIRSPNPAQQSAILGETINIRINGQMTEVPLSRVELGSLYGVREAQYVMSHPTNQVAVQLSRRGYETIADVVNNPALTDAQAFEQLGRAHYLLMHGTPFVNGSPAVVESLLDSVMRSRFGRTFTPKRAGVEPFWEAMFNRTGIDDYARRFRGFFE